MISKRINDVGGDIVLGLTMGTAIGFAFDNLLLGIVIGTLGGASSALVAFVLKRLSQQPTGN